MLTRSGAGDPGTFTGRREWVGAYGGSLPDRQSLHEPGGALTPQLYFSSDRYGVVESQRSHADGNARVVADVRAKEFQNQIRESVDSVGGLRIANVRALTIPYTISQAATRSRSPSSRLRLPRIDRAVLRAAAWAASSVTSNGTRPKGPLNEPSGACAECPAI